MEVSDGPRLIALDVGLLDSATRMAGDAISRISSLRAIGEEAVSRLGIPPEVIGYINYPTRFDSRNTRKLLAKADIVCPPVESYARVLWDYWLHNLRQKTR